MSISPEITVKANKYYIAFVSRRNFASVRTRRSKLILSLKKDELNDPRNLAVDISTNPHNPSEYSIFVDDRSDLEYILTLIRQSYEKT